MMAKYIDAETLIDELKSAGVICGFGEFLIERQPAADVQKVKHGKWIRVESSDTQTNKAYKCSHCKRLQYYIPCDRPQYCSHCGAKMDGENAYDLSGNETDKEE